MTAEFGEPGRGLDGGAGGNRVTVDLEFDTLREFREQMAPYLNYDGVFIKSAEPLPRGTAVHFRFVMPEGFVLAEGTGVVASTRKPETDPDLEPGMTLWFDVVEQQSKVILDELVDFHIATGGDAFDLGRSGGQAGEIPTDALAGGPSLSPGLSDPDPPDHETVPDPDVPARQESSEDYLPGWLSDVAEEHDFDLAPGDSGKTDGEQADTDLPRPLLIPDPEIEFSLSGGGDDVGGTPRFDAARPAPEVTMTPEAKDTLPSDLRFVPLVVAAAVLITASLSVWWVMSRTPASEERAEDRSAIETLSEQVENDPERDGSGSTENTATSTQPTVKPIELVEPSPEETEIRPVPVPTQVAPTQQPTARPVARASGVATKIEDISVRRIGDRTVVSVRANGVISEEKLRVAPMKDPARIWMRIRGIETFYRPNEIAVGSPEVLRVRVGHHPEDTPPSLFVVLDLADDSAVILDTSVRGDTVEVTVGLR